MDKIKILAVDDEIGILNLIKKVLHNHDITTETSSFKAAELIRQQKKFDIFIIDYQMPSLDGIDLLETIRDEYENKNHVSIFCTAYGTIYLFKDEMINCLFDYFLEKPFEIADLKQVFNQAITKLKQIRKK